MKSSFKFFSFWLLLALGTAIVLFNSCGKEDDPANSGDSNRAIITDAGVVINGVKWATRNVDVPGTFAAKPEDFGMFYQWNSSKAWAATGDVTDLDYTYSNADTWESANDPSPIGWRVPTLEEIQTLFDSDKVSNEWTTMNDRNGRKFTDIATGNSLFLPAAGYRYDNGRLFGAGRSGCYWSNMVYNRGYNAYYLGFGSDFVMWDYANYVASSMGHSIRAVAEFELRLP